MDDCTYLQPIVDKYGEHQGLNSNWSCMAWLVFGTKESGWWLLDDERIEETVSLVVCTDNGDGDPIIDTAFCGSVAEALVLAGALS